MTARRTAMPTSALDAGSQQIEMSPTSQGRAIASGAAHFDWELSPTLRLFMGLGCLAYWLDAYVLWRVGFAIPSVIFVIVALCSACADAVRPQGEWGRLARQIDRLWGTGGTHHGGHHQCCVLAELSGCADSNRELALLALSVPQSLDMGP
eukprot:CAMPEP_0206427942 /NCGR_PEP_ID=MMETSP0324_2-20121206/5348_1 /ASSEMBLY_ACC=CAM_ASM_000836 /TAXON_ID=2866 /ORGANISM="Crypthecodinium cohnii, Strain Seligo" /LENGTH=150 /DNA_ID=CAMNT_0053893333 /DNA_START=22 /DNA_END=474 /DNA_ORIENTATION=-